MPETISCPGCSARFVVSPEILGKSVRCRKCQTSFVAALPSDDPTPANVLDLLAAEESRAPAIAPPPRSDSDEPAFASPSPAYLLLMEYGHHLVFAVLMLLSLALLVFGLTTDDVVLRRICVMLGGFLTMILAWGKLEVEFEQLQSARPLVLLVIAGILVLAYNFGLAN